MAESGTRIGHLSGTPTVTSTPSIKSERFEGRHEAQLGKAMGLNQFGANHVRLEPGAWSSLRHWHEGVDEFVYVLSGQVTLVDENGEHVLIEGGFAGFPTGAPNGHHLVNMSREDVTCLVVGTRLRGTETIHYPDEDFGPVTVTRDSNGDRVE